MSIALIARGGLTGRSAPLVKLAHLRSARPFWPTLQPSTAKRANFFRIQAALLPPNSTLATLSTAQLPPMLQNIASPASLAFTVILVVLLSAWRTARKYSKRPDFTLQRTAFNQGVLSRCPTLNSQYNTWPFLSNGHVETILASKLRRNPAVDYLRESFETPDGGTVHIDYHKLPETIVSFGAFLYL